MKILITGVAGFIGFSLALKLLKKNKIVYGIDNIDNYYIVIDKLAPIEIPEWRSFTSGSPYFLPAIL